MSPGIPTPDVMTVRSLQFAQVDPRENKDVEYAPALWKLMEECDAGSPERQEARLYTRAAETYARLARRRSDVVPCWVSFRSEESSSAAVQPSKSAGPNGEDSSRAVKTGVDMPSGADVGSASRVMMRVLKTTGGCSGLLRLPEPQQFCPFKKQWLSCEKCRKEAQELKPAFKTEKLQGGRGPLVHCIWATFIMDQTRHDLTYLKLFKSMEGKHGMQFDANALKDFQAELARRHSLIRFFKTSGPFAQAIEEMASSKGKDPGNVLLCQYATLLKDPRYAEAKNSVAARLTEVLLNKLIGEKKNTAYPPVLVDALLSLGIKSNEARRAWQEVCKVQEVNIMPCETTLKKHKRKWKERLPVSAMEMLTEEVDEMTRIMIALLQDYVTDEFSTSSDELYLVHHSSSRRYHGKTYKFGHEGGPLPVDDPNIFKKMKDRPLVTKVEITSIVPRQQRLPIRIALLRPGKADAEKETAYHRKVKTACRTAARKLGLKYLGWSSDAVGSMQSIMWESVEQYCASGAPAPASAPVPASAEPCSRAAVHDIASVDYYHTIKSSANEASALGTAPPHSETVYADLSILKSAVPDEVIVRKDKFSDDLAAALVEPKVFQRLRELGGEHPMAARLGTGIYLYPTKALQMAVDNRDPNLEVERRVELMWSALLVHNSLSRHEIPKRNFAGCVVGQIIDQARLCDRAPWRFTTHEEEGLHGCLRTVHAGKGEISLTQLLAIVDGQNILAATGEEHGWDIGAARSAYYVGGRRHRNCGILLKDHPPVAELEVFTLARKGMHIAKSILVAGGVREKSFSPWFQVLAQAADVGFSALVATAKLYRSGTTKQNDNMWIDVGADEPEELVDAPVALPPAKKARILSYGSTTDRELPERTENKKQT